MTQVIDGSGEAPCMLTPMILKEILDIGAENSTGNSPDALVRRSVLASVLTRAGVLDDTEQALTAFKLWTYPKARELGPQDFIDRFLETQP